MSKEIILMVGGLIGIIVIGSVFAIADEIGRFCEETNPYQGEPIHNEYEPEAK